MLIALIIGLLTIIFLSKSKKQFKKEMIPMMLFSSIIVIIVIIALLLLATLVTAPKTSLTAKTDIENIKFGTKSKDVKNSTFYLVENKSNHKLEPAWDIKNKYIITPKTQLNFKRLDKNKNESLILDTTNNFSKKSDENNIEMKKTNKKSHIVMHYNVNDKQSWVYKLFHIKNESDIQKYDVYLNPKDIKMTKSKVDSLNKEMKEEIQHEYYNLNKHDDKLSYDKDEKNINNFEKSMKTNKDKYKPFIQEKGEK